MLKNRKLAVVTVLIIIVVALFFQQRQAQQSQKVESAKVKKGDLKQELTLSGSISADKRVILRFQTAGRLTYVGVKEGDFVKKGQLVATLDQRELYKRLQQDLNTFKKSRLDLDQTRADYEGKALTDAINRTIEKSQLTLNNSVIDVELRNISLQFSRLTSPISGIVTAVTSPYAGVNVIPVQAEFEIINPSTVYFTVLADQTEVTQLSAGMGGNLVLDAYPQGTIAGTVNRIGFTPHEGETGTVYPVKFAMQSDNTNLLYRVGMTGDVTFTTDARYKTLYLPIKFVRERNGKSYVFVMEKGKKKEKRVETGIETEEYIEITKGLREGEVVYD